MHGYADRRDEFHTRLRRIEGQVRGVQKMVEDDRYCIDILTQISSISRALRGVAVGLLDEHVRHCVADAITEGHEAGDEKIAEAMDAIQRLVKS